MPTLVDLDLTNPEIVESLTPQLAKMLLLRSATPIRETLSPELSVAVTPAISETASRKFVSVGVHPVVITHGEVA